MRSAGIVRPIDFDRTVRQKTVYLSLGTQQIASNLRYYFKPDKELSNSILLGVRVLVAGYDIPLLLQPQNPVTSPVFLIAAELRTIGLSLVNHQGEQQWENHVLFSLSSQVTHGKLAHCYVKPVIDQCFVTVFQPVIATGQERLIPIIFYYKPLK